MSVYAAIDLHFNNSVLAVLYERDRVLRQRRLSNELPAILRELEPFRDQLAGVVVESTYNWYWLVDGLMAHGQGRARTRVHIVQDRLSQTIHPFTHPRPNADARDPVNAPR
jgi:hypothetical protein